MCRVVSIIDDDAAAVSADNDLNRDEIWMKIKSQLFLLIIIILKDRNNLSLALFAPNHHQGLRKCSLLVS